MNYFIPNNMENLKDINIKSIARDPVEDAKIRITQFWEKEGKPTIQRVDSTIRINDIEKNIIMFSGDNKLTLIIQ